MDLPSSAGSAGLGARIRDARKARSLTQEDLAALLGVSSRSVGDWERGSAEPRSTTAAKLAEILGIAVHANGDTPPDATDDAPGETLPDVINSLAAARGLESGRATARAAGIYPETLRQIRLGVVPEADTLHKIARGLAGPDDIIADVYARLHQAAYRRDRAHYTPPDAAHDMTDAERALVTQLIVTLVNNRRSPDRNGDR